MPFNTGQPFKETTPGTDHRFIPTIVIYIYLSFKAVLLPILHDILLTLLGPQSRFGDKLLTWYNN